MNIFPNWFRWALRGSGPSNRVKVRNVSPSPSYSGSAIDDWETYKKREATHCSKCGKAFSSDDDKVGGHVRKVGGLSIDTYIVPLCKDCNHPSVTEPFEVRKSDMVRVWVLKRCRKKQSRQQKPL